MDEEDVMRRALAAYFRAGATQQPSTRSSGVRHVRGLAYAVLASAGELLAVYRVRNDGMLKRLKRWPEELSDV